MGDLKNIDHFVVLMLENRSFDSMLGMLYPKSEQFDGLDGKEFNRTSSGLRIPVWSTTDVDDASMSVPTPDPGEAWADMNFQLFGESGIPSPGRTPTMAGFVQNYAGQADNADNRDPKTPMHFYTQRQVPVLSMLARKFAVCDRWFASAPCQTWPNRFFVHTGTANGFENNAPPHFPYDMPTIYERFDRFPNGWKIYFHDMPQSLTLERLWKRADHFHPFEEFQADAAEGTLPFYSFIEPRYFPDVHLPNDQHSPHNVTLGEQLIAETYNCLRNGPKWERTLLIITYDEHGGCFDHVPPPAAVPPHAAASTPFNFDRFGVRVPAVLISPYIRSGTILRPTGSVPFDHTSILATLRKRFDLGAPLSNRDAAAPDLENVLTLSAPDNNGPEQIGALRYVPSPADVAKAREMRLNGMQEGLLLLSHMLSGSNLEIGASLLAKDAVARIKENLGSYFKRASQT